MAYRRSLDVPYTPECAEGTFPGFALRGFSEVRMAPVRYLGGVSELLAFREGV